MKINFLTMLAAITLSIASANCLQAAESNGTSSSKPFGKTANGVAVDEFILPNARGLTVSIISRGATIRQVLAKDRDGKEKFA